MAQGGTVARGILEGLAPALDRVEFARLCGIPEPDPWQRRYLSSESRRIIICAARQTGKSTCSAILALHRSLYYPKSTAVLVSPSLRQSQLIFRQALDFYRRLGKPVASQIENRLSLELDNGSVIASLPGSEKTVRGFSAVNLVLVDEAAAVDDTLWRAIQPMTLVSGGRLILVSTPRGKLGRYYELWRDRELRGWEWFHVPATDVVRIPTQAIADQRADMTEREFRQEILCEFLEEEGAAFKEEDLMAMADPDLKPLFGKRS